MFKRIEKRWGYYTEYFRCKWFCVKMLHFVKDTKLSVQRHAKRSELWVWNIKPLQWHTFSAAADTKILEIQYGRDVKEDDIERV